LTLNCLYDIADRDNIGVFSFDMDECESVSVLQNGKCYIAIDPFKLKTIVEEKEKLAHELGHCETGAFYNQYSKLDIRAKHERRANIWAIKKLIPKDELKKIISAGCIEVWDLAEYFEVSIPFLQMAIEYYAA